MTIEKGYWILMYIFSQIKGKFSKNEQDFKILSHPQSPPLSCYPLSL